MRKILAFLLALALLATPALAAGEELFPAKNAYPGFADVAQDDWFASAVQTCYEVGLMNGTGDGSQFSPLGVMSVAEAATIAARVREILTGEPILDVTPAPGEESHWYDRYVSYLRAAGAAVSNPEATATRDQFFAFLSVVVPEDQLGAINAISALPDTDNVHVLAFYNAGILTGIDDYGTFSPAGTLSRAECAAMVARLARPELRVRFTPQPKPTETQPSFEEELSATTAMLVNGQSISMSQFATILAQNVYAVDRSLLLQSGQRLNWSADYGVGDLRSYFIDRTVTTLSQQTVCAQQAAALGCEVSGLAQALSPDPSQEVLSAYAQGMDYLAAKHILISTIDPSTGATVRSDEAAQDLANQIIDALDQTPTPQQFDNLLSLFGEDPGMTASPEGYLFSAGEMVSEFETAVRQLSVGAYTPQPVKTLYGYHVILRLDPASLTALKEDYQQQALSAMINTWVKASTITLNTALLDQLDVQGTYEAYLQALAAQG